MSNVVEMNGNRPIGDDLPIALDFDEVPGGAHSCTNHPAPSTVRECIKCGATIFPHENRVCPEGHFHAVPMGSPAEEVMWCGECDGFRMVRTW